MKRSGARPKQPLDALWNSLWFVSFTQHARRAVQRELPWDTTVDEWIRRLPIDPGFKRTVLLPWITATIGCLRADAERASARSILQTFALAFPSPTLAALQRRMAINGIDRISYDV